MTEEGISDILFQVAYTLLPFFTTMFAWYKTWSTLVRVSKKWQQTFSHVRVLPKVAKIEIWGKTITTSVAFENLQKLKLIADNAQVADFKWLVACRNLRCFTLKFEYKPLSDTENWEQFLEIPLPQLKHFKFVDHSPNNTNPSTFGMQFYKQHKNLEKLVLVGVGCDFNQIQPCLKKLKVQDPIFIESSKVETFGPGLEVLIFYDTVPFGKKLLASMSHLRYFDGWLRDDNENVCFPKLRTLSLRRSYEDLLHSSYFPRIPMLQHLNLAYFYALFPFKMGGNFHWKTESSCDQKELPTFICLPIYHIISIPRLECMKQLLNLLHVFFHCSHLQTITLDLKDEWYGTEWKTFDWNSLKSVLVTYQNST